MKTLLRRSFFAAALLSAAAFAADSLPLGTPESVGMSASRLERISAVVGRAIENKRLAGGVTLVARNGKVVFLKAQGMADAEAGMPMKPDTIFRICSMTKPITSLAVMMLYEEGRFSLDDPISKFIPEFKNPRVFVKPASGETYTVPAAREITIRHLLTHSSGISYNWHPDLGPLYKKANIPHGISLHDEQILPAVKRLARQPLLFHPGDRFEYSLGIDVLGAFVEVVSGQSLSEFFSKRIFEPLGMRDTHFFLPDGKKDRLAAVYTYYPEAGLKRFPSEGITEGPFYYDDKYPVEGPKKLYAGGAGLSSTAADYWRFAQMMLNGGVSGNTRLISRKTVELMSNDQLGKVSDTVAFGLGFGIDGIKAPLKNSGSVGQYGWGGFYYTSFQIDPKEKLITVFMGQLHPTGDLTVSGQIQGLANQAIVD